MPRSPAIRKPLGTDYIGLARLEEAKLLAIRDNYLSQRPHHTDKEVAALERAEKHMGRAASLLRAVGNRMVNS